MLLGGVLAEGPATAPYGGGPSSGLSAEPDAGDALGAGSRGVGGDGWLCCGVGGVPNGGSSGNGGSDVEGTPCCGDDTSVGGSDDIGGEADDSSGGDTGNGGEVGVSTIGGGGEAATSCGGYGSSSGGDWTGDSGTAGWL